MTKVQRAPLCDFAEKPSADESTGAARRGFLQTLAIGVTAIPAALAAPSMAQAQAGPSGRERQAFNDIRAHENAHVAFLEVALGAAARPRPTFKNLRAADLAEFLTLARTFENVGVGAYLGAVPFIRNPNTLASAGSIAQIEARHAGFLNFYTGERITDNVFDEQQSFEEPLDDAQVRNLTKPFVESLNGGPPLFYTGENDIQILNFALALEYLEMEFYNINVPRFFPYGN